MKAVVWSDYLCPWCWLGVDRSELMRGIGVEVIARPYELHPEIPADGLPIRPDGRLSRVFDVIEAECDELGIPFLRPARIPNSRHLLETAEIVRHRIPEAFDSVDGSFFRAHWVEGEDVRDRDLVRQIVTDAGAPAEVVEELLVAGAGRAAVDDSIREAHELGITATPSWWIDDAFVLPGAQSRDTVQRWVSRLMTMQS